MARRKADRSCLLTPHFCNWEWLLRAGGATFRFPVDAVYQTVRLKSVDRYLREARSRFGGRPIPREDFIYELMSRAGTPQGYALIADQTPRRDDRKHWTRLINRDTALFVGAEKVARFLDARVLYVRMRRVKRGHYSVHFTYWPNRRTILTTAPDFSPVMEAFARNLELAIRASPADWLWVQKRWKYPKPAMPGGPPFTARARSRPSRARPRAPRRTVASHRQGATSSDQRR